MKMLISDTLRVRKIATSDKGSQYVTFVEAASEYQSPIQIEFPAGLVPGISEGATYQSVISVERTVYPARQVDGKWRSSQESFKALDFKPFAEVRVELVPVKAEATKAPVKPSA